MDFYELDLDIFTSCTNFISDLESAIAGSTVYTDHYKVRCRTSFVISDIFTNLTADVSFSTRKYFKEL